MRPCSVSQTGAGVSAWMPIDASTAGPQGDGIFVQVTGTVVSTIEVTPDNVFDPTVTPVAYATGVAALAGLSANQATNLPFAAKAIRVNQASGSGTTKLTFVNRSIQ